jgi:hypothetical protein
MVKSILNFTATLQSAIAADALVANIDVEGAAILRAKLLIGEWIYASIAYGALYEVVKITAVTGISISIERAKDYTTAREFPSGATLKYILGLNAIQDIATDIQLESNIITGKGIVSVTRGGSGEYIISAPEVTIFSVNEEIKVLGSFPNFILK